jgi:hypothetical protein
MEARLGVREARVWWELERGGELWKEREREVFVLFHIPADDQNLKSKL